MDLSELRTGGKITSARGSSHWRCTDIGTRTMTAIRVDELELARLEPGKPTTTTSIVQGVEAEVQGYFNGPPYMVAEYVIDEYDYEGCEPIR